MKFSTKSRYALRLMAELARYAPGTTVSLKEISERQNLSLKYLEQIHSVPWQRDQRVPHVRAVLHSAVLGGAGRGDQPVYRQRYAGAAGKPAACAGFHRAGELLQLRRHEK